MTTFTVTGASKKKDVPPKEGQQPMQVISLGLQEAGKDAVTAEWFTRATTPMPTTGSSIDGTLEDAPPYGLKFKKAQMMGGGFGGRGRAPEETKSIVRQHSQEMALRWMAIQAARGKVPDDFKLSGLEVVVSWFVEDSKR